MERPQSLLVHQGALGDFVLVLPLIRALAAAHGPVLVAAPQSRGWLARTLVGQVIAADVEERAWTMLHAPACHAACELLRPVLEEVRLAVSFVSSEEGAWSANFRGLAPDAKLVCLPTRPPDGQPIHLHDLHRSRLAAHGVQLQIGAVEPAGNSAGPIIIHPGSGGRDKCWPLVRYQALADALEQPVQFIVGEAEHERWEAGALAGLDAQPLRALPDLVATLRQARLYIGNDSGPTHLAAQLGLPTIALFGPTDPRQWAPRGPAVTVLAPPAPAPMTWLTPDAVLRVVEQVMART